MKDKRHVKSFGEFNENLNISDVSDSDYLDNDKKAISFLIGKNFKTTDSHNWRKGGIIEFTNEEYFEIKSIVDKSIIENNLSPSTYLNTISLMFEKIKNLKIVNVTIQKTDYFCCVHLQEYTGDRDYPRYDKTNTFLYQFSFDELKSFLTFLIERIDSLSK